MFNINSKEFEEALMNLINNSGLKVSEAYYIVENAALQLKLVYEQLCLKEQYEGIKTEEQQTDLPINEDTLELIQRIKGDNGDE